MLNQWLTDIPWSWQARRGLVCGLGTAHGIRVLLGEKRHSDSDFLLIFSYNRLQKGNEILFLLGVLFVGYVATELAQQIDVMHEGGSPFIETLSYEAKESGIQEILYGIEQRFWPRSGPGSSAGWTRSPGPPALLHDLGHRSRAGAVVRRPSIVRRDRARSRRQTGCRKRCHATAKGGRVVVFARVECVHRHICAGIRMTFLRSSALPVCPTDGSVASPPATVGRGG